MATGGEGGALAAIKGLMQVMAEGRTAQQEQITALEAQNSSLQARLAALESASRTDSASTAMGGICPPAV